MPDPLPPALLTPLAALLGPGGLLLDAAERLAYGYDNSRRQGLPLAVALPTTAAQVQAIVALCRAAKLPIVARGRGTNTTGASVPGEDALVVSFERMNQVLAIRPGDRVAVVQPGLLNGDLQAALAPHGLFWPPDPTSAAYCTVGGNLACNAGGPRAVKYGATRDNVLALTAVTGAGELVRFGAPTTKGASGYDLSRLLIGSEGTLALIVEATLRLTPVATHRRALRALYADVDSAAAAVARLMAQPVTPSLLEFMDGDGVRLAREVGGARIPAAGALLMIEADGEAAVLDAAIAALTAAARGEGGGGEEKRDKDRRESGGKAKVAHEDLGVLAGRDPEDLADFLAVGSEGAGELHLQREPAGEVPVVLVFHRPAIEDTPLEVGDIAEEDDFREGFLGDGGRGETTAGCLGRILLDDFIFIIAEDDIEIPGAAFDRGEADGFCGAFPAAPCEGEGDVLEG